MGTSFYEQNSLSGAHLSFNNSLSELSMLLEQPPPQPQHHPVVEDPSKKERRRKKRSSKSNNNNPEGHSKIKNSLEQFLVDSQFEDFLFEQKSVAESTIKTNQSNQKQQPPQPQDNLPPQQGADLFDRNALAAAGKTSKRHRHRRRKSGHRKQQQQQQQQQSKQRERDQEDEESLSSSKVFATSLSKIFDGDHDDQASEASLSLSDLRDPVPEPPPRESQKPTRQQIRRSSTKRSRASRPPQCQSTGSSTRNSSMLRPRSQITTRSMSTTRSLTSNRSEASRMSSNRSEASNANSLGTSSHLGIRPRSEITKTISKNGDLARRLSHLDKQVRRDRMKKEYRTPSVDIRNNESFSTMSTKSSTKSSYRRTGFEGGALNAIMGNESFAKIASRGGDVASLSGSASYCSTPSDDRFLRDRKAKQDKILDTMASRLYEPTTQSEAKEHQQMQQQPLDSTISTSEELQFDPYKPKGIVKKMKKAVRKTAKLSKSGAKVAANAVMEPKRVSRRGYKPAPESIQAEEPQHHNVVTHPNVNHNVNPPRRTSETKQRVKRKKESSTRRKSGTTTTSVTTSLETTKPRRKSRREKSSSFTSVESSSPTSKTLKKKKAIKPTSFTSHGSMSATSPVSKRTKSSKPNSFTSFESTSPFFTKANASMKGRTVATKLHDNSKMERDFNDSFSGMFPEFHLSRNSQVVWWDI